jgi:hypothetical protein
MRGFSEANWRDLVQLSLSHQRDGMYTGVYFTLLIYPDMAPWTEWQF